ncbi:hypothetical protein [Modestobacter italicus]|uniref:hypothetical protein n=1 Tax=Modestobacter italicus (strain DSM 44449 / CECT 9708 / BC 501) TaxID=2732864 RepID=UPI001C9420CC|nr:hypothetical protein [Modestobacter italicus]
MRVALLVYGAVYVVIEIVGYQLEQVSWPEITPLDVATALADAFLTVAVLVAVLVAGDLLGHRWRRHLQATRLEQARLAAEQWAAPATITVPSWRPGPRGREPLALPAARVAGPPAGHPYAGAGHATRTWPGDAGDPPGRLL